MKELVFNAPWWLPTLIILGGLTTIVAGNRRLSGRMQRSGASIILAGIALGLVNWLVQTDVERVELQTQQLAAAIETRDWATMNSLLDPTVDCLRYHDREQLIRGTQLAVTLFKLKSLRVRILESRQAGGRISITMVATGYFDVAGPQGAPSNWKLDWMRKGDHWVLVQVSLLPDALRVDEHIRARAP